MLSSHHDVAVPSNCDDVAMCYGDTAQAAATQTGHFSHCGHVQELVRPGASVPLQVLAIPEKTGSLAAAAAHDQFLIQSTPVSPDWVRLRICSDDCLSLCKDAEHR